MVGDRTSQFFLQDSHLLDKAPSRLQASETMSGPVSDRPSRRGSLRQVIIVFGRLPTSRHWLFSELPTLLSSGQSVQSTASLQVSS